MIHKANCIWYAPITNVYVAYNQALKIWSQGTTEERAKAAMVDAISSLLQVWFDKIDELR